MTARQTTVAALAAEKTTAELRSTLTGHVNARDYLKAMGRPVPHPLAHEIDLFERALALKEDCDG